ncbi:MAG: aldo/keto reductase, partial [Sedimenticola sp.]
MKRRDFLLATGSSLGLLASGLLSARPDTSLLKKRIPSTGEKIPVVGMGSSITFNVGNDPRAREQRTEVLRAFFEMGGGMIDSSPMYGS